MTVPCNGCKERALGCHATCEKYINYKQQYNEIKQKRFKEHEAIRNADALRAEGIKNVMRGRNRK